MNNSVITAAKENVQIELQKLEALFATATPDQIAQTEKDIIRHRELFDGLSEEGITDAEKDALREEFLSFDTTFWNVEEEIVNYKETLAADLMHIETKYLVTEQGCGLLSPAGIHPSERIFVQTPIAIHTNTLDMKFPHTGKTLVSFEVEKAAA